MFNTTALIASFLFIIFLLVVIKKNLIKPSLIFPVLLFMIILGVVSTNNRFIALFAKLLGIKTGPLAIILALLLVILISCIILGIEVTNMYQRQLAIIRYIAKKELSENALHPK